MEKLKKLLGGDYTPIEHGLYAVLMQIVVNAVTGSWVAGATFAIGFFFGREHAQQQDFASKPMGDWQAAMFWQWDWPSQMDFYVPTLTVLFVLAMTWIM